MNLEASMLAKNGDANSKVNSKHLFCYKGTLVEILAFVEVNIDYAEEDLPQSLLEDIEKIKGFTSRTFYHLWK